MVLVSFRFRAMVTVSNRFRIKRWMDLGLITVRYNKTVNFVIIDNRGN